MKQDMPLQVFRMKSMIFGSKSSPFMAQYLKNFNAKNYASQYPEAGVAIVKQHYVDDDLDSNPSVSEALKVIKEVISIHAEGGFLLRDFVSNSKEDMNRFPPELLSNKVAPLDIGAKCEIQRFLGYQRNS
jgi:hypothetical protein